MFRDNTQDPIDTSDWTPEFGRRVLHARQAFRVFNIALFVLMLAVLGYYISVIVGNYLTSAQAPSTAVSLVTPANVTYPTITYCPYPGNNITLLDVRVYVGEVRPQPPLPGPEAAGMASVSLTLIGWMSVRVE